MKYVESSYDLSVIAIYFTISDISKKNIHVFYILPPTHIKVFIQYGI